MNVINCGLNLLTAFFMGQPDKLSQHLTKEILPKVNRALGGKYNARAMAAYVDIAEPLRGRLLAIPGAQLVPKCSDFYLQILSGEFSYPGMKKNVRLFTKIAEFVYDNLEAREEFDDAPLIHHRNLAAARLNYLVCATLTDPQQAEAVLRAGYIDKTLDELDTLEVELSPEVRLRQPQDVQAKFRQPELRSSDFSGAVSGGMLDGFEDKLAEALRAQVKNQFADAASQFQRFQVAAENRAGFTAIRGAESLGESMDNEAAAWQKHLAGGGNLLDAFHAVIAKETVPRV